MSITKTFPVIRLVKRDKQDKPVKHGLSHFLFAELASCLYYGACENFHKLGVNLVQYLDNERLTETIQKHATKWLLQQ
jgi:hypothetical protein